MDTPTMRTQSSLIVSNDIPTFENYRRAISSGSSAQVRIHRFENITVDDTKLIRKSILLEPLMVNTIHIISADTISELSQNVLLKLIEECPAHASIVLWVSPQLRLLDTILSRVTKIAWIDTSEEKKTKHTFDDRFKKIAKLQKADEKYSRYIYELLDHTERVIGEQVNHKKGLAATDKKSWETLTRAAGIRELVQSGKVPEKTIAEFVALFAPLG